jgi:cell division protein FtsN
VTAPEGGGRTLSRDFKHVKRHTSVTRAQAFSGWAGLAVGLGLGLSVALGVFLHYRGQPAAEAQPAAKAAPRSDVATDDASNSTPTQPGRADNLTFYDILKDQQVDVPADPAVKPGAKGTSLPKGDVMLQAGSFKQQAEAEKLVAKLALNGIAAKIQRFPMDDETWYRVRIGPITTAQEYDQVRAKLDDADIVATPVAPMAETAPP